MDTTVLKQPEDADFKVWRYLDLAKLTDILKEKQLYLSRLDLLGDPHEGSLTKAEARQAKAMKAVLGWSGRRYDGSELAVFRKRVFANCWRMDNHESNAMWKLYCPDNQGVAIQTTYRKLANSSNENLLRIGMVEYDNDDEGEEFRGFKQLKVVINKKIEFEYEKEIRIIGLLNKSEDGNYPPGYRIPWDIKDCIECVFINPYADESFKEIVENTMRAFGYAGMRVEWSKMRGEPFY